MRVGDVMTKEVVVFESSTPVRTAAEQLAERRVTAAPVTERGRLLGVLAATDLLSAERRGAKTVRDAMTPFAVQATAEEPLRAAVVRMAREHVGRVVVVDREGAVRGVVTASDVMRALEEDPLACGEPPREDHADPASAIAAEADVEAPDAGAKGA